MEQDGYLLLRLSWHYIFRALCACHCVEYFISCVCMCARTHLWAFVCAPSLSCVWLFVTPWTVACPAPLSIEFSRQEHWSGLPFPPSGDLPYPKDWTRISFRLLWRQVHSLPLSHQGSFISHNNHNPRNVFSVGEACVLDVALLFSQRSQEEWRLNKKTRDYIEVDFISPLFFRDCWPAAGLLKCSA